MYNSRSNSTASMYSILSQLIYQLKCEHLWYFGQQINVHHCVQKHIKQVNHDSQLARNIQSPSYK